MKRLIEVTGSGYDAKHILGIYDVMLMSPEELALQRSRGNREFVYARDYDALRADLSAAKAEEEKIRTALWLCHGCNIATLYGDNGEKQCNNFKALGHDRPVNFKTDPLLELAVVMVHALHQLRERAEQAERALATAQAVAAKCRVAAKERFSLLFTGHKGGVPFNGDVVRMLTMIADEIEAAARPPQE